MNIEEGASYNLYSPSEIYHTQDWKNWLVYGKQAPTVTCIQYKEAFFSLLKHNMHKEDIKLGRNSKNNKILAINQLMNEGRFFFFSTNDGIVAAWGLSRVTLKVSKFISSIFVSLLSKGFFLISPF